tara:strand:+ start:100 stop:522 length:423 start_codon:yes stop_codon:yes gene_type:complete
MGVTVDKYKKKGLKSYDGDEQGNVFAGQLGLDTLNGLNTASGREHIAGAGINTLSAPYKVYHPEVRFWISLKALSADVSLMAKTAAGDDFMRRPELGYDGQTAAESSTFNLDLQAGDLINGIFTRVRICDATTYLQASRG